MNLIFLDIDGVLNGSDLTRESQYHGINPRCVAHFNRVLSVTDARIVLSSSWRYMISGGTMTVKGFENMLRTHGVACEGRLIGCTCPDESPDFPTRGQQINDWLDRHDPPDALLVLDDSLEDIQEEGLPLLLINGAAGMTECDADRAIEMLTGMKIGGNGGTFDLAIDPTFQ